MPTASGQKSHVINNLDGDSLKRELTVGAIESTLNH